MIEIDAHASFAADFSGRLADTYVRTFGLSQGIYSLYSVYKGERSSPELFTLVDEQVANFKKILDVESPDDPAGRLYQYLTGTLRIAEEIRSDLGLKVNYSEDAHTYLPA